LSEELGIEEKNILNFKNEYKNLKRHKIAYFNCDITDTEAIDIIIKKIKENKKILILLNTVNKSILLKQKLDELLGDKHKIILLHSRFMTKDRFKKEEEIFDLLNQNVPHILIATQVAEVSLDISYDYLFTELSSFSSFIQRCGRVNRFNNFVKYENVFVFYPSEINKLSERNKNKYPYLNEEIKELEQILLEIKNKDYNEFDLINIFDEINSKDDFIKKYQKESIRAVDYSYIFTDNKIFSLNYNEEAVRNALNYRESFNVLSVPQIDNIENEDVKIKLEEALKPEFKYRDFEENMKKLRKIKEFLIPVPIWFTVSDSEETYFPIIKKDYFYNKELGLYKKEFKDEDLIL
jgi:CRISPR-associated endonuclease/helicase Cas3